MSPYLYYLSYAREDRRSDRHDCIGTFHEDLAAAVRRIKGPVEGHVGFFDGRDIESGNDWSHKLSEALSTSRVFVPIYSPYYFAQDYCGREWKIFSDRLEEYKKQNADAKVENLIQPVLWGDPRRLLDHWTDAASRIQYTDEKYPSDYEKLGLHTIATSQARVYEDMYWQFIRVLADRIVDAAKACPLPPLNPPKDIEQTIGAFGEPNTQTHDTNTSTSRQPNRQIHETDSAPKTSGPRYVKFIYVAGKRDELQKIREDLDYYGHEGGSDWKPFLPKVKEEVWKFANEVAIKEDLQPEPITLDANIIDTSTIIDVLEDAEGKNKIVVIVVDTWTLRLSQYYTFIHPYDDRTFFNCVVLIPWNPDCDETERCKEDLEKAIKQTFPRKWISGDKEGRFLHSINSLDELKTHLSKALHEARELISRYHEVRGGETESIPMKPKPTILGPGG